jgi:hypothetical protein
VEVKQVDYHQLFLVPMGLALLGAVILALFFHPKKTAVPQDDLLVGAAH